MRKHALILVLITFSLSGYGQLTISGKIEPSPNWKKLLYVVRIDKIGIQAPVLIDSILLAKDGSFKYTFDSNPQGIFYELRLPPKDGNHKSIMSGYQDNWVHVISESNKKSSIVIKAYSDSIYYSANIKGDYLELNIFRNLKRPISKVMKRMMDSIKVDSLKAKYYKEKYAVQLFKELDKLKSNINRVLDTCKREPIILAGIYYLNEAYLNSLPYSQIKKYIDKLTPDEHVLLARNLKRLESSKERNRMGIQLPDMSLDNYKDGKTELKTIKGKYKVIDFWASWCSPCRYANKNYLPELNSWLNENKIPLIGISIDNDKSKWKEAVKKDGTTWHQVLDSKHIYSKLLDIGGIPQYIVLDENDLVIYEASSSFQVKTFLKTKGL